MEAHSRQLEKHPRLVSEKSMPKSWTCDNKKSVQMDGWMDGWMVATSSIIGRANKSV